MALITVFIITNIVYSLFLNILFILKENANNTETRIFSWMVKTNLLGLILELLCYYTLNNPKYYVIGVISSRLLLLYFLNFLFLMTLFVFSISFDATNEDSLDFVLKYKKYRKYSAIVYIMFILISMFAPIHYISTSIMTYSFGAAVDNVFAASVIAIITWGVIIIKNNTKIEPKKYWPLLAFIFLGLIGTTLQKINPHLTIMTAVETIIIFIMYFTIENPDIKLIREISIARTQAERANDAKTDFLSNMSHEIRTPLNAIVGFSQLLQKQDVDEELEEDINNIVLASENLLEIVNGILDISKIEANKLEIVNTQYNFEKVINEVISLAKSRQGEKALEFKVEIDPTIPKYLYGDYVRLKQILLNLLTNSIKYTKEGYYELKINSIIKDDVCRLIISIEDSGIGIKKEKIDTLFHKFQRFDLEDNITIEGTGLGLAITKRLVDLMNGEIVVQSEYGKGSKFTVALDQKIVKFIKDVDYDMHTKEIATFDGSGKRILVVDDNLINLKVVSKILRSYLIEVDEVSSGQECLERIKDGNYYDLILLDDMMPVMNGVTTLKKLKEIKGFKTPVVMLTANALTGMREKYLSDGFDDYIPKPIDQVELYKVIKRLLYLD